MAITTNIFRNAWVQQQGRPNCGSCCMGSIVNYAKAIRHGDPAIVAMDNNAYVGLTVGGIHSLGSVTAGLSQWLEATYPAAFTVREVKIRDKRAHRGGITNKLSGGKTHRPRIDPDAAYFAANRHRFLLREFSVAVVAGHFIIQTGADEFWDPNRQAALLPETLANVTAYYGGADLSERADALQIDVKQTVLVVG